MKPIRHYRLSSDFLFTYTTELNTIKLIMKYGLRHSLNIEMLPYKNSLQENFIVCFCDILPDQADFHKSVYGNYSIAFTKEWGIENGITPLSYIHKNSPGATSKYVQIKNDIREARKTLKDGNQIDYFLSLILFKTAREKGLFTHDAIEQEFGNIKLLDYLSQIDNSFNEKKNKFGEVDLTNLFNEWIVPLLHLLEGSVDELEQRDAYMRIYQGDFRDIKDKILYDEREWRSVKFITESENIANPYLYSESKNNGYLPQSYNLRFNEKDISAVLVESDFEKHQIKKYITDEVLYLKGVEDKVFTFSEYNSIL